jgi:hypothetical protein
MIQNEFDVELVFQDESASIFSACRPDVWHFVLATTNQVAPNYQSIDISQFHWLRYSVARALTSQGSANVPHLVQKIGIQVGGEHLTVTLRERQYRMPENLLAEMRKDLPILEKAAAEVKAGAVGFEVSGTVTSRGYPVVAEQRSLAEAIAFERETRNTLDPRDFAVYSAFCTWRDFLRDDPNKKRSIATGMAQEMMNWDPDVIGDDACWESIFEIQERLWGVRIWGPGVDTEQDALIGAFFGAFDRLSSIQFAQFVLMNGMHQGGPFHALATLFGLIDFDGYKYWRTREFQPDSAEEQEIRTHSSFIELLGLNDRVAVIS